MGQTKLRQDQLDNTQLDTHIAAAAPHSGHALAVHSHDYNKYVHRNYPAGLYAAGPISSPIDWTDMNVASHVGANSQAATLILHMAASVPGTSSNSALRVRKNGTSDTLGSYVMVPFTQNAWVPNIVTAIVGLDASQIFEYKLDLAPGASVYIYMYLVGYFV